MFDVYGSLKMCHNTRNMLRKYIRWNWYRNWRNSFKDVWIIRQPGNSETVKLRMHGNWNKANSAVTKMIPSEISSSNFWICLSNNIPSNQNFSFQANKQRDCAIVRRKYLEFAETNKPFPLSSPKIHSVSFIGLYSWNIY